MAFVPHSLRTPALELDVLPYGLTIHALRLPSGQDLLVGPADPAVHHYEGINGRAFRGQTVGRYANRLPAGRTSAGFELSLEANEGDHVCLHGGKRGLDTFAWERVPRTASALFPASDPLYATPTSAVGEEVVYRHVSPAGSDGFPLTLEIEGLISTNLLSVTVVLRARIVDDGAAGMDKGTPVNLTVHWGWNLATFDGAEEDVLGHRLFVDSSATIAIDDKMLATGELSPSAGTPFDFQQGIVIDCASHRRIGDNYPANGIDDCFIFNTPTRTTPAVVLSSPDGKISLSFHTNSSAVQIYSANFFDGTHPRKIEHCSARARGAGYAKAGAIFLEFQHPLGTFLNPKLIQAAGTDTVLHRNEVYENSVTVHITRRE